MKNPDVESHLRSAVTITVPDVLNNILSQCEDRKGKVIEMKSRENRVKKSWVKPFISTAAVLTVLAGGVLGTGYYQSCYAVDSIVLLDVNPSIEIEANKKDEVLSVIGLNEDGKNLISQQRDEGKKLEGAELETLAKELAAKMAEEGYLTELKNSVLVSVQNDDDGKSQELKNALTEGIKNALSENGLDAAVLGQRISENEELMNLADEYGVSLGKAEFISDIIENHPELSFEELSEIGINDLMLIAEKWVNDTEGKQLIGNPSDKEYMSAKLAIENAGVNASLLFGENVGTEMSLGYADGKMVYDVKIRVGETESNCGVDAKSGELEALVSAIADAALTEIGTEAPNVNPGGEGAKSDYEKELIDVITDEVATFSEKVQTGNEASGEVWNKDSLKEAVTDIFTSGADYFKK